MKKIRLFWPIFWGNAFLFPFLDNLDRPPLFCFFFFFFLFRLRPVLVNQNAPLDACGFATGHRGDFGCDF